MSTPSPIPFPLFVALDDHDLNNCLDLVDQLPEWVGLKIGTTFLYNCGFSGVRLVARDRPLMIDAKLHDIPTTMIRSAGVIIDACEPRFITVHIEDIDTTKQMLSAIKKLSDDKTDIVGVIKLSHIPLLDTVASETGRQLANAYICGVQWIIASSFIVDVIGHTNLGDSFKLIGVGIRLKATKTDDHTTTMTPVEAINHGANAMVLGRLVTQAAKPAEMLDKIVASIIAART